MDRRYFLAGTAGTIAALPHCDAPVGAKEIPINADSLIEITLNREFQCDVRSASVTDGASTFHPVVLGTCRLTLSRDDRLEATVKVAITQYAEIDYWISLAVFDDQGTFLGAATHKHAIHNMRRSQIATTFPILRFDFGISRRYQSVARLAAAISDRSVPKPR